MFRSFGWIDVYNLIIAAKWTIYLSVIALVCGALAGLIIALCRTSNIASLRFIAMLYIRLFQGTPLLMQLFLVYFGLSIFGLPINPLLAATIGLTFHASAFLGEIWRGCIEAVPLGQTEASKALGIRYFKRMRFIILPQAMRIALAPTVGFMVQLIKGTSLTAIIGFVELTRQGQIINSITMNPFAVFGTVAMIYFIICWPLSLLARHMQTRLTRSTNIAAA